MSAQLDHATKGGKVAVGVGPHTGNFYGLLPNTEGLAVAAMTLTSGQSWTGDLADFAELVQGLYYPIRFTSITFSGAADEALLFSE